MDFVEQIEKITKPYKNAVITIGNFDGVHLGHQALFQKVIEKAEKIGGTSVIVTFEPHPMRILKENDHPPLITLHEQKMELIENSGIDVLICIPFNKDFAALTANEFVEDLLVNHLGMKAIVVGEDYTFGKNREGSLDLLENSQYILVLKFLWSIGYNLQIGLAGSVVPVFANLSRMGRLPKHKSFWAVTTRSGGLLQQGEIEEANSSDFPRQI